MTISGDQVLALTDIHVQVAEANGEPVDLVDGVTLHLERGSVLGLVGESGSGKSLTALTAMKLPPAGLTQSGQVILDGIDVSDHSDREMRRLRGSRISLISQDPMTGLNPVRTIGSLMSELLRRHQPLSRGEAKRAAVQALRDVGIPSPEVRIEGYAHQLSGGLRQRVLIAMALLHKPSVIIADEPTTALDATIQAQIIDLLKRRVEAAGLVMITHDLGVAGQICDRIAVMYAGQVVEIGQASALLRAPRHPYTAGLLAAAPVFDRARKELTPIPGSPPVASARPAGCPFAPRCPRASDRCVEERPVLAEAGDTDVACWHPLG